MAKRLTEKQKDKKISEASKKHSSFKKVFVKCDLAYSSGGDCFSDEPYSNRTTETRHYEVSDNFLLDVPKGVYGWDSVAVPDWQDGTKTVYAILVHYSTGDTFGRTEGCIDIPIAFVDVETANTVAKKIDLDGKCENNIDEMFIDFEYGFNKSWTGYFEQFYGVEVKKLTLETNFLYKSKRR